MPSAIAASSRGDGAYYHRAPRPGPLRDALPAEGGIAVTLGTDVERTSAEIGYWLGETVWGRGIASAAVRAVSEHAFAAHGLTRLFAVPYARNTASVRVLEKAGYVLEGCLRRSAIKDGVVLDQLLYALVR